MNDLCSIKTNIIVDDLCEVLMDDTDKEGKGSIDDCGPRS